MIDGDKIAFVHHVIFIGLNDIEAWPVLPPKRVFIIADPGCIVHHVLMNESKSIVPSIEEFAATIGSPVERVHEIMLKMDKIERNQRSFDDLIRDMRDELLESIVLLNDRIDHYSESIINEPTNYPKQIKLKPVHYNAPVIKPKFIRKGNRNK